MKYEIVITTYRRPELLKDLLNSIPRGIADIYIYHDDERLGCVALNNRHFAKSDAAGVICLNDDMVLEPNALENLIEDFEKLFPDTDGIVGMNQINIPNGSKCAAWIIGQKYLQRFDNKQAGFSGYKGRYWDSELMYVARQAGKFYWSERSKLLHLRPQDQAMERQESFNDADRELFFARGKNGGWLTKE
jgi:hypothetical protein